MSKHTKGLIGLAIGTPIGMAIGAVTLGGDLNIHTLMPGLAIYILGLGCGYLVCYIATKD
jgi:hypothetical protein